MRAYAVVCDAFRLRVETDDTDVITRAARQGTKFVGQPLANLSNWMQKFGGLEVRRVGEQGGLMFDAADSVDPAEAG
jgi:hypothetical protein